MCLCVEGVNGGERSTAQEMGLQHLRNAQEVPANKTKEPWTDAVVWSRSSGHSRRTKGTAISRLLG